MRTYEQANAVAVGSFNPAIFHPSWFEENEILPRAEIQFALNEKGAVPLVVTRDLTQVQFESVLLKVTQERFEFFTERPDWRKDVGPILSSIFQALVHTPVSLVGFNVIAHRPVASRSAVLDKWLPLGPLASLVGSPDPELGLPRITGSVKSKWEGYRALLTVEPSAKLTNGIHLAQNFEKNLSAGAKELISVTQADWERILKRAEEVAAKVLEVAP